MANEIMKVHPHIIHHLDTTGLSPMERKIFKVISWMVRDEGSNLVTISFHDFRRLLLKSNDENYKPSKLIPQIEKAYKKILSIPFKIETTDHIRIFNVFFGFEIDKKNETISIAVNKEWNYLFNNIKPNVYYELIEYQGLSSGYAQLMYEFVKDFRTVGHFYEFGKQYKLHDPTPIEEFRKSMGISDKQYRTKDGKNNMRLLTQKVLNPIEKELSPIFIDFKIEKIKSGPGNKIIALRFTWKPEEREIVNRISDDQRELRHINKTIQLTFDNLESIEKDMSLSDEMTDILEAEYVEAQRDLRVARIEKELLKKRKGWFEKK